MTNEEMQQYENHPCNGCYYWRDMFVCYGCHYLLITGSRRGCPAGAGCVRRREATQEEIRRDNKRMFQRFACGESHDQYV